MADHQQAILANSNDNESDDGQANNQILQLNDDCLIEIFRYASPMELCSLSDTCKRFQNIARIAFKCRWKNQTYVVPTYAVEIDEHPRILRCFGDLFHEAAIMDLRGQLSSANMQKVFDCLERYCKDTLQSITLLDRNKRALPPSAVRLMTKVKKIELYTDISRKDARALLSGCKELVELKMVGYQGPFHLYGLDFPNLRILSDRVQLTNNTQFSRLETFFETHSKLTELSMEFLVGGTFFYEIDLTFISYLVDLETLELQLSETKVCNTEALTNLKKLKGLTFDHSDKVATDIKILNNIPVDNLVELTLGLSEINDIVTSIARFKNLTHLTVTHNLLPIFCEFDVNISELSQLRDSRLIQLKIVCRKLLEPETIVAVIRNLSELKVVIFDCKIDLTEPICKKLVAVCSGQKRCIEVRLCEEVMDAPETDLAFIKRFNEQNGMFVRITMV